MSVPKRNLPNLGWIVFLPAVPVTLGAVVALMVAPVALAWLHERALPMAGANDRSIAALTQFLEVSGTALLCATALFLVIAIAVVLASIFVHRHIDRRILELVAFTEAIADRERPDPLPVRSNDGLGRLTSVVISVAEYVWSNQEELEKDSKRQQLDAQVQRALSMADTEEAVLETTNRALERVAPDHVTQLMLADGAQSSLLTVLAGNSKSGCDCPVATPRGCAAVRRGQSMVFWDGTALDACPQLRLRDNPPDAAVCVPLTINGQAIGVVHTPMAHTSLLSSGSIDQLKTVVRHSSARIGMIRALRTSQIQAETDPLTGLLNRRSLEIRLKDLADSRQPFAMAIADLDHFKKLNDTHGHHAGDQALKRFTDLTQSLLRPGDFMARLGGEEFLLVFPNATCDHALAAIKRVRAGLARDLEGSASPKFTCSYGVAEFPKHGSQASGVLERADEALYRAKESGRDRAVTVDELVPTAPTLSKVAS